ncbi:ABC transporter permease [Streptomyces hainanensis]|uniref:ABC transporter permease n=1 Tax=Streptomyces hainanensis TaxID=402648 RepID=A0A4R4T364_9ACTN|nr:ABC transporter permease subunit [Streptomyces hainanensis]TDC71328.1 ABC transporter permease [Streptomyces hainanensis]
MTATPPPTHRRSDLRRALVLAAPAVLLGLLTLCGPLLAPEAEGTPVTAPYAEPGGGAPLGGDLLGRDVLSRVLHGGGPLIGSALVIALAVTLLATLIGCLAALRPGLGRAIERTTDFAILLPPLLGVMLLALAWPGGGRAAVVAAAVVLGTPYATRIVAGAAAPFATTGFVESAIANGEGILHLAFREILPNLRSTVIALFGLRFVEGVYIASMAGFLQLGPQPPAADWALMVKENAPGILLNPWAVIAPSIAISVLAVSVNLATAALARNRPLSERTVTA